MHEVIANQLWLGNERDARDIESVLDYRIVVIIDLALEELPVTVPRDIVYCRIPLVDGSGNRPEIIRAAVELTASFIELGVTMLVACGAGMSRAPLIVAASLAQLERKPLEEVLEEITAGVAHDVSTSLWADVKAVYEEGTVE